MPCVPPCFGTIRPASIDGKGLAWVDAQQGLDLQLILDELGLEADVEQHGLPAEHPPIHAPRAFHSWDYGAQRRCRYRAAKVRKASRASPRLVGPHAAWNWCASTQVTHQSSLER